LAVKANRRRGRFVVSGNGRGVASRSGTALVAEVGEFLGVSETLQVATEGIRRGAVHSPGQVLSDLALMLADGGTRIRHLAVLRGQPALFGPVASAPTATRTIAAVADTDIAATVARLDAARAVIRQRAWEAGALPAPVAAVLDGEDAGPLSIDLDATLVSAHSDDKDGAAATYKRTWGFHPMTAWLDRGDGTGEALAAWLRAGNANANHAGDQIAIVDRALAQLPDLPEEVAVLVRADTAGAVHDLVRHLRERRVLFSVGMALRGKLRAVIADLNADRWVATIRQDGSPRPGAGVAEITNLVDLSAWPPGARLVVRREPLHPGAQQTFDHIDGYRFTAFLTDQSEENIAVLDARHRAHARVEDRIRGAKNSGLAAMPCDTFDRNQIWTQLVTLACDLLVFTQRLTLTGEHAIAEPKALRYKLLHVAARIVPRARQVQLRIQHDWPWVNDLVDAFHRLRSLPRPAT
jgi:hypothetical protein